ncbi:Hypothetical Protein FCC1311_015662 [Hondaea fermentalgiana]|uniref:Uncharacterized protein n=1 Tax=Hondaea fermentalgiana TaxID=2315210 RepID=A0A2R5G6D4_9STRA|nr:Hypothetical Protein FCC1311_015662 [Hondaea fermentalgiana]|eukprot:GBG25348.1 Hypothetical Protein FCC1311_015662 [Hondaea fermentalgiana]
MRPGTVSNTVKQGREAAEFTRSSRSGSKSGYQNMLVSAQHERPGDPGTRSMPWDSVALSPPDASLMARKQSQQQQQQLHQAPSRKALRPPAIRTRKLHFSNSSEWPPFASKTQCLYVSFAFFSLPLLVVICFAMIFYLADPARLDPEYVANCTANYTATREYLCGSFAVLAFLGTVGLLVLWVPTTTALIITVFHKRFFSELPGMFVAAIMSICAAALFSLGVILVVRSDHVWAFYTYAYFAIVLGGALGLILIAVGAFYLGSVLVLTTFTMMGYPEDEIRREFMYGGTSQSLTVLATGVSHGSDSIGDLDDDDDGEDALYGRRRGSSAAPDLENQAAIKDKLALKVADDADMTDLQAAKRAIKREKHKLDVERRRLEKLDENIRKREQAVRDREEDLEELESRLQKREADLEEAEEEIARQLAMHDREQV